MSSLSLSSSGSGSLLPVLAENNKINRFNSNSVGGGRDTSRKGCDGDKKEEKDSGKDPLSLTIKLESDVKRLKCDLQLSRNRENDLRDQIVSYMSSKFLQFYLGLLTVV